MKINNTIDFKMYLRGLGKTMNTYRSTFLTIEVFNKLLQIYKTNYDLKTLPSIKS